MFCPKDPGTVLKPLLQMCKLKPERSRVSCPRSRACWSKNRAFSVDLPVSLAQCLTVTRCCVWGMCPCADTPDSSLTTYQLWNLRQCSRTQLFSCVKWGQPPASEHFCKDSDKNMQRANTWKALRAVSGLVRVRAVSGHFRSQRSCLTEDPTGAWRSCD